jgi:hypothetical protein
MVHVLLFDQSLDGLETYAEIFDHHSQKEIHKHESDDQNEHDEVNSGGSLISAIPNNRNFAIGSDGVFSATAARMQ